jgi:hypothetical protein
LKYLSTILLTSAILTSCVTKHEHHKNIRCNPIYSYADQSDYDVYPNSKTNKNIDVDMSGLDINLSKIDRLTDEVELCLKKFGYPAHLPDDVVKNGECERNSFEFPIHRECLTVKVAANWFLSKYEYGGTLHQQLPYTNGGQCTNKGLPAGVCYYRNTIQDDYTIVVPPSFYLYKDALVRIATGCHNPWYDNSLAECMTPTTNPLDDGSQP